MTDGERSNNDGEKPVFGASGRKIVYDKDGKPYVEEFLGVEDPTNLCSCRTCNTLSDFQFATRGNLSLDTVVLPKKELTEKKECPPDVEQLGRSSWTLLHSIAATYPEKPTQDEQCKMREFIDLFGKFYPCWYCGEDFVDYTKKVVPRVDNQEAFGKWLCDSHNAVNEKLGKPRFDCNLWKQRWKDGWDERTRE